MVGGYFLGDTLGPSDAAAAAGLTPTELERHEELVADGDGRFMRVECESFGLRRHRRGDPAGYWLTIAQAAEHLGVSVQAVYKRSLPISRTGDGRRVMRRVDFELLSRVGLNSARPDGMIVEEWLPDGSGQVIAWVTYLEAARAVGRSPSWVRSNARRGLIRRRIVQGKNGRQPLVAQEDATRLVEKAEAAKARNQHVVLEPVVPPGMMSIVDAAQTLGCGRSYVHTLGNQGRLTIQRGRPFSWVVADQVHQMLRDWFGGHDPGEVMTYTEAAVMLGLSIDEVRRLVRGDQLRRVGKPRHIRVLRIDVEKLAIWQERRLSEAGTGTG